MNYIKLDTPLSRYFSLIGYYNKFREVWFDPIDNELSNVYGKFDGGFLRLPEGVDGMYLLTLRKALSAEYKLLEGNNNPEEEAKRTGAAIGFDWQKK